MQAAERLRLASVGEQLLRQVPSVERRPVLAAEREWRPVLAAEQPVRLAPAEERWAWPLQGLHQALHPRSLPVHSQA